jgi:RNA polymerase sigma-70 factor, ECF subfamily
LWHHPGVVTLIRAIVTAYPSLRVAPDVLAQALAERSLATEAELEHVADVYLAEACARGDEAALRVFDAALGRELDLAIAKSPSLGVSSDEFRSIFRERFLVAEPGGRARVATYRGQGTLKSWVRVAAARLVVDLSRKPKDPEPFPDAELLQHLPQAADPELEYLRRAYAAELPQAFDRAILQLTVRQRNLLRQRHLHGLGGAQLATLYGVHRATVFAWLDAAREALLGHLRDALQARVAAHDLDSIVKLLGSQFQISVRRLLDSRLEDEPVPHR